MTSRKLWLDAFTAHRAENAHAHTLQAFSMQQIKKDSERQSTVLKHKGDSMNDAS